MTDINLGSISPNEATEAFEAFQTLFENYRHTVDNPDSYTKEEVVRELGEVLDFFEQVFNATAVAMEMAVLTNGAVTDFTPKED